jgi:hypothetical protein
VYICGVEVVADQLGVFSGSGSVTLDRDQAPAKIIVRIPDPGPTYDDGVRYPLDRCTTALTELKDFGQLQIMLDPPYRAS